MFKTKLGYLLKVQSGGTEAPNIHRAVTMDPSEQINSDLLMELNWRRDKEAAEQDLKAFASRHGLRVFDESEPRKVLVKKSAPQRYSNVC